MLGKISKIANKKRKYQNFANLKKKNVHRSKGMPCSLFTYIHIQAHKHESEYRGHPFIVSECFPSTYHQGSVQYIQGDYDTSIMIKILATTLTHRN